MHFLVLLNYINLSQAVSEITPLLCLLNFLKLAVFTATFLFCYCYCSVLCFYSALDFISLYRVIKCLCHVLICLFERTYTYKVAFHQKTPRNNYKTNRRCEIISCYIYYDAFKHLHVNELINAKLSEQQRCA